MPAGSSERTIIPASPPFSPQKASFSRRSLQASMRTMLRIEKSMRAMARKPYTPKSAPCEWMGVVLSPCA